MDIAWMVISMCRWMLLHSIRMEEKHSSLYIKSPRAFNFPSNRSDEPYGVLTFGSLKLTTT